MSYSNFKKWVSNKKKVLLDPNNYLKIERCYTTQETQHTKVARFVALLMDFYRVIDVIFLFFDKARV